MNSWLRALTGVAVVATIAGCGAVAGTGSGSETATEIPTPESSTDELATPVIPEPTEVQEVVATPEIIEPPEPSPTLEVPTNTPVEEIATLVAVEFGTFPQFTDDNGNAVPWSDRLLTESIPNAGFFLANAPEGVELLSLDCQILFDGQVVYQREGSASDFSLFGPDFLQNSYIFADANFLWPDFDGDGSSAPIVSGEYTMLLRGETNAGATVQQSIPFTIDLEAVATPTPVDGEAETPAL